MHVHLVFVTQYRREVFTKDIIDDLRGIFASVCADFEAQFEHPQEIVGRRTWSPSYFAGSCGGALLEIIRQYIEQQQTPH